MQRISPKVNKIDLILLFYLIPVILPKGNSRKCTASEAALCLGLRAAAPCAVLWVHKSCYLYFACQCWNFRGGLYEERAVEVRKPTLACTYTNMTYLLAAEVLENNHFKHIACFLFFFVVLYCWFKQKRLTDFNHSQMFINFASKTLTKMLKKLFL